MNLYLPTVSSPIPIGYVQCPSASPEPRHVNGIDLAYHRVSTSSFRVLVDDATEYTDRGLSP